VCDLDLETNNPIVGTRAFGADPVRASECAAEWIAACQSEGVLACAKHFPGHGRTETDSHCALPVVRASSEALTDIDLAPFRAAIATGVASLMTAHVAYPALDSTGQPATLSREILHWLLRQRLKFDGLVISDAMTMAGVRDGRDEAVAVVEAIRAGCDLVLDPVDLPSAIAALETAAKDRRINRCVGGSNGRSGRRRPTNIAGRRRPISRGATSSPSAWCTSCVARRPG
jgi:beta-glucosidase-like glycosyl hydrolase